MGNKSMQSPYQMFEIDKTKAKNGAWLVLGNLEFRCAFLGPGSSEFLAVLARRKKKSGIGPNEDLDEANPTHMRVMIETTAEVVLSMWRTRVIDEFGEWNGEYVDYVLDRDGKTELSPSFENRVKLLIDLPILRGKIAQFVSNYENYRSDDLGETVGN